MEIPSAFLEGFERGRVADAERAERYVGHTCVGDPVADEMVADLSEVGGESSGRWLRFVLHGGDDSVLRTAPASVRRFYESCIEVPDWVDLQSFLPGCRMFHRNSRLILAGMVGGVLVEGFATTISKSFFLTGRLRDKGVRRLKQNNRHMLEIFMPSGLERHNDGWAHSVRVRLVHARVRSLISRSGEWDSAAFGVPVSSAQLGFALSAFSARLLYHLVRLGGRFTAEERRSFISVWRYSGHLMGIPGTILYRDEADALELFRIGRLCEPPPSIESIVLASSLINSAPLLAGFSETGARRKLSDYIANVSRALIGDELADQLMYPGKGSAGTLWRFRTANRIERYWNSLVPGSSGKVSNLTTILDVSVFDREGIRLDLPDHVHSERSSGW